MDSQPISALRERHSELVFERCGYELQETGVLFWSEFTLAPSIRFRPTVMIGVKSNIDEVSLRNIAFHLGLIESISYWKAACPRHLRIRAGTLSSNHIAWWRDLYLHGLGEFLYRNAIDFSTPDFLEITCEGPAIGVSHTSGSVTGDLILAAGGKDSSLALELLEPSPTRFAFALNPTRATLDSLRISGHSNSIVAKRSIDPELLRLNREGYLNGHTPFSAYLAFLGTATARLAGLKHIIVSNESSASEENVTFHGMPVNHQYSKSFRFERMFAEYSSEVFFPECTYFSFLRPLSDLQIGAIFASRSRQLESFRSCNVNQRADSWCGRCPKCAFVFLSLFPFVGEQEMVKIFGSNLFERDEIAQAIQALVGISSHKPFECVGSIQESRVALALVVQSYEVTGRQVPERLVPIIQACRFPTKAEIRDALVTWRSEHRLPPEFETILRGALAQVAELA